MRLGWLGALWVLGIFLGMVLEVPLKALGLLLLGATLLLLLLRLVKSSFLFAAVGLLFFLLGLLRMEGLPPGGPENPVHRYNGAGPILLRGMVIDDPQVVASGIRLRLKAQELQLHRPLPVAGEVLVTLRPTPSLVSSREAPYFRYGDILYLQGELQEPPLLQGFDYRDYLARQGVHSIMLYPQVRVLEDGKKGLVPLQWISSLRATLARNLALSMPEPQASLSQALLLGLRRNLPSELNEAFRRTGTSHLLAISGLHVGVLLGMVLGLSQALLGRRRQLYLLPPFGAMWLYALVSGLAPPVVRAAIMGSFYLLGHLVGRPGSLVAALALAAALMVGLKPGLLKDVSFQLSFTAMAGLVFLYPLLSRRIREGVKIPLDEGRWWAKAMAMALDASLVTVAATVATLPLLAFYFRLISLVGVPATLLSLPALPFILATSALTAIAAWVASWAGQVVGWVSWLGLSYLSGVVYLFSGIPGAAIQVGEVGGFLVWGYYGLMALALVLLHQGRRAWECWDNWAHKLSPKWSLPLLGLGAILVWTAALSTPDGKLHVVFLDVGQGDSILVQTAEGHQILVDGGPHPLEAVRAVGQRLPFWDRSLDLIVLTHPNADHIGGLLEVVRRYQVGLVLERPRDTSSTLYLEWRRLLREKGIPVVQAEAGQEIRLGRDTRISVLHPGTELMEGTESDLNNNSVIIRLVYGDFSFLITGDIQREGQWAIISRDAPLQSTVLKVPHHGSRDALLPEFLEAVRPKYAVISVGQGNPFGHPHPETLEALEEQVGQGRVLITAEQGWVEFMSDGYQLWVKTER